MTRIDVSIGGIDLYRTLRPLSWAPNDPTTHLRPGQFARATRTPDGPATIEIRWADGVAAVTMWGDGESWLLDHLEPLLGLSDDVSTFVPEGELVTRLWRQFRGIRLGASHTLWHDVAWLIPGQRVTSEDASRQWMRLTKKFAEAAPGPLELLLPPPAAALADTHYTELHELGLERKRATNLRAAGKYIPRFERELDVGAAEVRRRIELIPGVGQWTSTNVATITLGDPDQVVLGDYAIPSMVTFALAGERKGTDARMLELLEPHRPHRWRVCRLLMAGGLGPPRRSHRLRNPRIERM